VLHNVTIFQFIPECLLHIINEEVADSNRHFTILKEDPLVAWHFDELNKADQIQLNINAVAEEDCVNQAETRALARNIINIQKAEEGDLHIWPPIITVAIIFILLFFLSSFTREKHHDDDEVRNLVRMIKRRLRHSHNLDAIAKDLQKEYSKEKIALAVDALKHPLRQFFIKTTIGLEFIILLLLIVFNILDFFKILSGDVDFIKKIVSWILLLVVFNHVGISKVLFGKERRWIDATLLVSFFLLTLKNFIGFVDKTIDEASWAKDLYIFIKHYNIEFQTITFLIGIIGILIVTFYISYKKHIHKESLFGALFLHKHKERNVFIEFFQVLAIELLFFVLVFNLMFEWLAIAVDAPILVLVLIITLVTIILKKLHHHKKKAHLVETVTEAPDHFYENIIELFHHPKFVPLGIAGMFVLHLVTEIGIYVIPYALGIIDPVYVDVSDYKHTPLFSITHQPSLYHLSAAGFTIVTKVLFAAAYAANLIALALALVIPLWLWMYMYKHKSKPLFSYSIIHVFKHHDIKVIEHLGKIFLALFPVTLIIALSKPAFSFQPLTEGLLLGVNILTYLVSSTLLKEVLIVGVILLPIILFAARKYVIATTSAVMILSAAAVIVYDFIYLTSMINYIQTTLRLFNPWTSAWFVAQNITIVITLILVALSILSIYITAAVLLAFMYLPTSIKLKFHDKLLPKHIAEAQHHHHIHFHHVHDHHMHGPKVQKLKEHIEKQLNLGHELFLIVEEVV